MISILLTTHNKVTVQGVTGNVLDMGMGCPEGLVGLNPAIRIPMSRTLPIKSLGIKADPTAFSGLLARHQRLVDLEETQ